MTNKEIVFLYEDVDPTEEILEALSSDIIKYTFMHGIEDLVILWFFNKISSYEWL